MELNFPSQSGSGLSDYIAALPSEPLSNLKPDPVKSNCLAYRLAKLAIIWTMEERTIKHGIWF
jgi:hypothetical protein